MNSIGGGIYFMTVRRHCTVPFIITLLSSRYDLNNVERDVKHQIIISTLLHMKISLVEVSSFNIKHSLYVFSKCQIDDNFLVFSQKIDISSKR